MSAQGTPNSPSSGMAEKFNQLKTKVETLARNVRTDQRVGKALMAINRKKHLFYPTCRVLICLVFINAACTDIYTWMYYHTNWAWHHVVFLIPAILVMLGIKVKEVGLLLLLGSVWEAGEILFNQISRAMFTGRLYLNELMVKKFSLVGCVLLLLAHAYSVSTGPASAIAGVLKLAEEKHKDLGRGRSLVLLLGRLLLCILFLYLGWTEISSQWNSVTVHHGHKHRARRHGDGHDSLFFKSIEFVLAMPLAVGFQTYYICGAMAGALFMEAFLKWGFWTATAKALGLGYSIHAREHFLVNVSVAAGLLFLQHFGAGKFSVDEYMKKHD